MRSHHWTTRLAFLIGAVMFARLELSMVNGGYALKGAAWLAALLAALRIASLMRPRRAQIDFNEGPEGYHQLGLHS